MKKIYFLSLTAVFLWLPCFAQISPPSAVDASMPSASPAPLGMDDWRFPALKDTWRFTVGPSISSRPSFQGSSTRVIRGGPVLGATYGRYFIGSTGGVGLGLGAYLLSTDNLRLGLSLSGGGSPRRESLDPRLAGLGDVSPTVRGNLFAS